MTKINT